MEYLVPVLILAALVGAAALWLRISLLKRHPPRDEDRALTLLQNQMNAIAQQTSQNMEHLRNSLQQMSAQMGQSLQETNKNMGERLDSAAKVIHGVSKQLGELEQSSRRIFEVGTSIKGLEEVLRSPKLRGNIGELFLHDLLSQILPPDHYRMQYTFKGGEKVDAVIFLQPGMVPVDAKFPLENFRRISQAENETSRQAARKEFVRDVKKHVDDIANKYIRTDEGTFDFALMYIPAENVYYETIIKEDEKSGDMALFTHALNKRVIPVSPNSFYAYLQTVLLGLKGMRVEESAREIINHISRLRKEFEKFNEAFRLIGTHLERSVKQYGDAEKRLGRIEGKMEQIDGAEGNASDQAQPMLESG